MMTSEQLATLVSWLREQAGDGAHQPPSEHGQRFTEAADYIESTSRALAVREKVAMTAERWAQLKGWTWFREGQAEVTIELDRARAAEAALRVALDVDLGRADRDAIYRHDLKALAADGAIGGCHTDVGTAVRNRLAGMQAELAELRPKPACGNRFGAHVCIKRQGHSDLHGDGDGGEWS